MSAFVRIALIALASAALAACSLPVGDRCGADCALVPDSEAARPDGTVFDADSALDAPVDRAVDAAPDSAMDVPADIEADVASDGPLAGELGAPCSLDSDCHSGICLPAPVGRCSVPCGARTDCPVGTNWSCSGIPGRGTICDCAPHGTTEIACNSIDDDCDGVTDQNSGTCDGMCVDLWASNTNCGHCGISCGGGSVCQHGACGCPPERPNVCASSCVNTATDVAHCGSCATACMPQANSTAACAGGSCAVTCNPGFGDCNAASGDGCESDVRTDLSNCGMCGRACSFPHASAACSTGTCVMGACDVGHADCNGSTLDGCETALATDSLNCGACAHACVAPNATSVCTAGACSLVACSTGFGNCDASAVNGCEVSLLTDPSNCSVCGGTCPARAHASNVCAAGSCGFVCSSGFADCDGAAATGCETSLLGDPNHCGSCGTTCPAAANQSASCASGVCQATCSAGFGNCDGIATNGCETDVRTLTNCGACGAICTRANASAQCVAGICSTLSCATYFSDCDGVDSNGCEANVLDDPLHCGACGTICPGAGAPNAAPICTIGLCGLACASDFANCDSYVPNGCETDLRTTANCGACGNACPATQTCSLGSCGCPAGQVVCGPGTTCIDTNADPNNCGSCGHVCSGPTPYCSLGACTASGSMTFNTAGSATFIVPAGVTTVSVVVVGAGGSGTSGAVSVGGGGGGALCYLNAIPVTPGSSIPVYVGIGGAGGVSGAQSSFNGSIVAGGGGGTTTAVGGAGGTGFGGTCFTGGNGGGFVGSGTQYHAGGGGAAGYGGAGGRGSDASGSGCPANATPGTGGGGGGGGGGSAATNCGSGSGAGGGGVGLNGLGGDGLAGSSNCSCAGWGYPGGAGSGGAPGSGTGGPAGVGGGLGGNYGGGGGSAAGANGAVRVIWGTGRSFPNSAM